MKSMEYITIGVALALLAGCATTFRPWKLSEVEEGMDRGKVVGILGEPDSVETKDGAEFLYYVYSENYNPPPASVDDQGYDANREFREHQLQRSLKEYRYVVKLAGGKVLSYKELTD